MFKCSSISFFLGFIFIYWFLIMLGNSILSFDDVHIGFKGYFLFDSISFYLMFLVFLLGAYSQLSFFKNFGAKMSLFLFLSLLFSVLCFCANHSMLFWCFYELAMLPLLYLMFSESPYSERFLAGWYFACYLLVTSLPLILLLIYLSVVKNSCFFKDWSQSCVSNWVFVILSFIFFTKVPLVPFHTWLPMVHAEATSMVSIFLSGYMMKLGLLGVYRCSYFLYDLSLVGYLLFCFMACVFFFIMALSELDGKRWLAFLSLSHIVVPFIGFFMSDNMVVNNMFFYCLGHGLSAAVVFGLLWYFYDVCKSRKWLLLKHSVSKKNIILFVVACLLSLCSFPPTMQFFCEVNLMKFSVVSLLYLLFWCMYLFMGGLVPLMLCGHLLIRSEYSENYSYDFASYLNFILLLLTWCYMGFLFI